MNVVLGYMQHPDDIQCKEGKSILQYIQGTRTYDIHYVADSELELVGYTYFDWVGDSIGGGPIFWSSKKQASITLSSAEAKYRGAVNAYIQAVWLQGILSEFDHHHDHMHYTSA